MLKNIGRHPLVITVVVASFIWNLALLVGVVFNLGFAHSRAAGGRYLEFPTGIRAVYLVQFLLVAWEFLIFISLYKNKVTKPTWAPRFFVIVGILGTLVNAASRSSNERINVIPAIFITWAFWYLGVRKKSLL